MPNSYKVKAAITSLLSAAGLTLSEEVVVCTPPNSTISCAHEECTNYVPGECFTTTERYQGLIPDMSACYEENYPELFGNASLLWNERVNRGIPAIASALATGTIEGKHMAIDIALGFDHWDIIIDTVEEILAEYPSDPHALAVKIMYGSEDALPGVSREDALAILDGMFEDVPHTARFVDESIADMKMTWEHEFLHPLTSISLEECAVGMNSTTLSELFPNFMCEDIPEVYNPRELAVVVFGAAEGYALDARIEATRALAERYPQMTIIATGGALATEKTEGDLIYDALPEYQDRIVVDPKARDTIGNALFVADWLKENDHVGNLLILTSTWHVVRASVALRGVLKREGMYPKTYLVASGNNVNSPPGTWSEEDQAWLETDYGGTGRFRAIEFPMTYREFSRGAGYFTMCDFNALEFGNESMDAENDMDSSSSSEEDMESDGDSSEAESAETMTTETESSAGRHLQGKTILLDMLSTSAAVVSTIIAGIVKAFLL